MPDRADHIKTYLDHPDQTKQVYLDLRCSSSSGSSPSASQTPKPGVVKQDVDLVVCPGSLNEALDVTQLARSAATGGASPPRRRISSAGPQPIEPPYCQDRH
jgi:hypothetical protein